jgi:membrane-bound serine protease (ClpP class)
MLFLAMPVSPAIGLVFAASPPRVLTVKIDSVIEPVTNEIVSSALDRAAHGDSDGHPYDLVILQLNTPGGLMDSMRDIIAKVVASKVPVATFVGPSGARAASAGFFILESGDVAAMASGTNTGAAHPVTLGGTQMDPVMKQKVENDAAAALRSVTLKRQRNSALAESAVLQSKSFTESEALAGHLIELVVRDEAELIRQLDGREITRFDGQKQQLHLTGATVVPFELSLRQRILVALSDPNVALIFLALGAIGIYAEFSAPGMILPGVFGAICAVLALAAISVLPISWLGASLLVLAAIFFALEIKVPSHGVLTTGGAIALVLGAMLLIDSPIPEMRIHLSTALAVALPFALITTFLLTIAIRARKNKVATGLEAMIGKLGVAVEELNPTGRVMAHGEYWNASSAVPIHPGEHVKVVALNGFELKVDKIVDQ